MPLLGAQAVQELELLTINEQNFVRVAAVSTQPIPATKPDILERYADVFADTAGNLTGMVHLETDPTVRPVIMPARKLPLTVEQPVKDKLAKLISTGILEPLDEPTTWMNQMAVPVKPSGTIRICLGPRGLNTALMREHYTLPTLDRMLHKLRGAKVFSKADLRNAFWHLTLAAYHMV